MSSGKNRFLILTEQRVKSLRCKETCAQVSLGILDNCKRRRLGCELNLHIFLINWTVKHLKEKRSQKFKIPTKLQFFSSMFRTTSSTIAPKRSLCCKAPKYSVCFQFVFATRFGLSLENLSRSTKLTEIGLKLGVHKSVMLYALSAT